MHPDSPESHVSVISNMGSGRDSGEGPIEQVSDTIVRTVISGIAKPDSRGNMSVMSSQIEEVFDALISEAGSTAKDECAANIAKDIALGVMRPDSAESQVSVISSIYSGEDQIEQTAGTSIAKEKDAVATNIALDIALGSMRPDSAESDVSVISSLDQSGQTQQISNSIAQTKVSESDRPNSSESYVTVISSEGQIEQVGTNMVAAIVKDFFKDVQDDLPDEQDQVQPEPDVLQSIAAHVAEAACDRPTSSDSNATVLSNGGTISQMDNVSIVKEDHEGVSDPDVAKRLPTEQSLDTCIIQTELPASDVLYSIATDVVDATLDYRPASTESYMTVLTNEGRNSASLEEGRPSSQDSNGTISVAQTLLQEAVVKATSAYAAEVLGIQRPPSSESQASVVSVSKSSFMSEGPSVISVGGESEDFITSAILIEDLLAAGLQEFTAKESQDETAVVPSVMDAASSGTEQLKQDIKTCLATAILTGELADAMAFVSGNSRNVLEEAKPVADRPASSASGVTVNSVISQDDISEANNSLSFELAAGVLDGAHSVLPNERSPSQEDYGSTVGQLNSDDVANEMTFDQASNPLRLRPGSSLPTPQTATSVTNSAADAGLESTSLNCTGTILDLGNAPSSDVCSIRSGTPSNASIEEYPIAAQDIVEQAIWGVCESALVANESAQCIPPLKAETTQDPGGEVQPGRVSSESNYSVQSCTPSAADVDELPLAAMEVTNDAVLHAYEHFVQANLQPELAAAPAKIESQVPLSVDAGFMSDAQLECEGTPAAMSIGTLTPSESCPLDQASGDIVLAVADKAAQELALAEVIREEESRCDSVQSQGSSSNTSMQIDNLASQVASSVVEVHEDMFSSSEGSVGDRNPSPASSGKSLVEDLSSSRGESPAIYQCLDAVIATASAGFEAELKDPPPEPKAPTHLAPPWETSSTEKLTAPEAQQDEKVDATTVNFSFEALDYGAVMASEELRVQLPLKIKSSVAKWANVHEDFVMVNLSAGSVKVEAVVICDSKIEGSDDMPTAAVLKAKLEDAGAADSLIQEVGSNVESIPSIQEAVDKTSAAATGGRGILGLTAPVATVSLGASKKSLGIALPARLASPAASILSLQTVSLHSNSPCNSEEMAGADAKMIMAGFIDDFAQSPEALSPQGQTSIPVSPETSEKPVLTEVPEVDDEKTSLPEESMASPKVPIMPCPDPDCPFMCDVDHAAQQLDNTQCPGSSSMEPEKEPGVEPEEETASTGKEAVESESEAKKAPEEVVLKQEMAVEATSAPQEAAVEVSPEPENEPSMVATTIMSDVHQLSMGSVEESENQETIKLASHVSDQMPEKGSTDVEEHEQKEQEAMLDQTIDMSALVEEAPEGDTEVVIQFSFENLNSEKISASRDMVYNLPSRIRAAISSWVKIPTDQIAVSLQQTNVEASIFCPVGQDKKAHEVKERMDSGGGDAFRRVLEALVARLPGIAMVMESGCRMPGATKPFISIRQASDAHATMKTRGVGRDSTPLPAIRLSKPAGSKVTALPPWMVALPQAQLHPTPSSTGVVANTSTNIDSNAAPAELSIPSDAGPAAIVEEQPCPPRDAPPSAFPEEAPPSAFPREVPVVGEPIQNAPNPFHGQQSTTGPAFYYRNGALSLRLFQAVHVVPTVTGAKPAGAMFQVHPPLPDGLAVDHQTGAMYGVPRQAAESAAYEVVLVLQGDRSKTPISRAQVLIGVRSGGPAPHPKSPRGLKPLTPRSVAAGPAPYSPLNRGNVLNALRDSDLVDKAVPPPSAESRAKAFAAVQRSDTYTLTEMAAAGLIHQSHIRDPAVVDDQGRTLLKAALEVGEPRVLHYLRNSFLEGPTYNAEYPSDIKYKPPYLTPLDEPPVAKPLPITAEVTPPRWAAPSAPTCGHFLSYPDLHPVLAVGKRLHVAPRLASDGDQDPGVSGLAGPVGSFSIDPELPPGMMLDSWSGVICGMPAGEHPSTTYNIRVVHHSLDVQRRQLEPVWEAQCIITFSVASGPGGLQYPVVQKVFEAVDVTKMDSSFSVTPTLASGSVSRFEIEPELPEGMEFNSTTGEIHGLPRLDALSTGKSTMTFCIFAVGLLGTCACRVRLELCTGAWNLILIRLESDPDNELINNDTESSGTTIDASPGTKRAFVPRPPPGAPQCQRGRRGLPGYALMPIGKVDWELVLFKTASVLKQFGQLVPNDNEEHLYPMVKGMDVPSLQRCLGLEEDRATAMALVRAVQHAEENALGEPRILGVIDRKNETLIYLHPEPLASSPLKAPRTPRTPKSKTPRTPRSLAMRLQPATVVSADDTAPVEKRFERELPSWRQRLNEETGPTGLSKGWGNFPVVS
eukprot:gnl/MRDRNA2_/MRDRNA2_80939_c0_seq1.p1 gnl/MRDRNA2_/MRDRNA2_80939_c0~~gnl/MRDRNA2_/MRDRNA2_80939_c0_seq1.p1  ORF type:complete len:2332 (-),score=514.89 gnl/MRDRNA2_/MRDRNA2_80939_c0_seq1:7-7002(-)